MKIKKKPSIKPLDDIDRQMMLRAIALAKQAEAEDEVPIGAVVYRDGKILGEGYNQCEQEQDATLHAEIVAMRAAAEKLGSWRLNDCTLAVTLEPCPMCAGAMINARLGRLVYGADDPKKGAVHSLYKLLTDGNMNHAVDVHRGVLREPCGQMLTKFFKKKRR